MNKQQDKNELVTKENKEKEFYYYKRYFSDSFYIYIF